ncbi:hypothetical protein [Novosphingobium capsulatum]|uniref:hypothetical protein n=1 Tax=Novosphingobium capsulatum TaxID=13688 RepID=UPI0035B55F86
MRTRERGDPPGCDTGTKIKGRKRHIFADNQALVVAPVVWAADVQDGDILASIRNNVSRLGHVFADGGAAGE